MQQPLWAPSAERIALMRRELQVYIDRYEDRGTGWKIAKRRELVDWARTDPAADSFLRETPALVRVMGARGAADFSNQRNWP